MPEKGPSFTTEHVILGVILGFAAVGSIFGGIYAFAQLVAKLLG